VRHHLHLRLSARSRIAVVAVATAILVSACGGGGGDDRPTLGSSNPTSATTATSLPANASFIAQPLSSSVKVHDQADDASPSTEYPNPWLLDDNPDHTVPQVFLVEERQPDWVRVLLPVRPNGTTGWIKSSDVRLTPNRYRIAVERGAHQITVYNGDKVVVQEPVAVGTDETPTPTGKYYLRVLLKAPDPNTVYGPYAYGLSAHSDVLTEFNGGDGEVGIHGNNDASVLGKSVTHGCVRMSNESITRLAGVLPLGTPVEIVP
jgi:lipoprotein-anchoring transpeptidase ErfK/SrfK